MSKINSNKVDFTLTSTYKCVISETISSDGTKSYSYSVDGNASRATCTQEFIYSLPTGSEIKSVTLHATLEDPNWGVTTFLINGESVDFNNTVSVALNAESFGLSGTVSIPFAYACWANAHSHPVSSGSEVNRIQQGNRTIVTYHVVHESELNYKNVYLEIEYTCGPYLYHAEGGKLVRYQFFHAENGVLVPYMFANVPVGASEARQFYVAGGDQLHTSDGDYFKVLGG